MSLTVHTEAFSKVAAKPERGNKENCWILCRQRLRAGTPYL